MAKSEKSSRKSSKGILKEQNSPPNLASAQITLKALDEFAKDGLEIDVDLRNDKGQPIASLALIPRIENREKLTKTETTKDKILGPLLEHLTTLFFDKSEW